MVCVLASLAAADEGMWLYNKAPVNRIKAKYGFEPTQAWLDHLRLGSVRFNNGGSGSFVSPDGLTFTNHHVGRVCLQQLSTDKVDYIKTGFYAKTEAEEAKCPDLELNVLMNIKDVTAEVHDAATKGMTAAEAGKAEREKVSEIETNCAKTTGLRCDVVTLYSGGMYNLYEYKKYTDVRLVFAPEASTAFFGGDPDNFEFPRYDLDITFFRVYEKGKPVQLGNDYLRWAKQGVKEGDLVFVSGNPGGTDRAMTMAQLGFMRDVSYPFAVEFLTHRDNLLKKFSAESEENARVAADDIFGIENSLKVYHGRVRGLADAKLMETKQAEEDSLRKAVDANPELKAKYGDAWDKLAAVSAVERKLYLPYALEERGIGFSGELAGMARNLVRVAAEKEKPSALRLREYSDARLPSLEQGLFSSAPIYKSMEETLLTDSLTMLQDKLGAESEVVKAALNGKTPAEVAKNAVDNTKLYDVAFRKELFNGGEKAIAESTDPMIVLMRSVDPEARAVRKQWQDEVESVVRQNATRIAQARFAVQGTDSYPDATFTLRLAYGTVKGYEQDGKKIPAWTTMGATYKYAAEHGDKDPYKLAETWVKAKSAINPKTPFDFVSTADIIGGNSGSPTVDKNGNVVGIVFDMNEPSLVWDFAYDSRQGRCVHVDSRAIIEALRNIYHANGLANELEGIKK